MNNPGLISIIALLGWLVLAASAYRSYQMNWSETLRMALIWAAIFAGVTFVFTLFT